RVHGRGIEHHRDVDDELALGRDDRLVDDEGEQAADVGEVVRHFRAAFQPVGGVADVSEVYAGIVEIIPDREAVQVVRGAGEIDDRAGGRVEQHRDDKPVSEGRAGDYRGLARRVLLLDLLDRDQQVLAVRLDLAGRAVD